MPSSSQKRKDPPIVLCDVSQFDQLGVSPEFKERANQSKRTDKKHKDKKHKDVGSPPQPPAQSKQPQGKTPKPPPNVPKQKVQSAAKSTAKGCNSMPPRPPASNPKQRHKPIAEQRPGGVKTPRLPKVPRQLVQSQSRSAKPRVPKPPPQAQSNKHKAAAPRPQSRSDKLKDGSLPAPRPPQPPQPPITAFAKFVHTILDGIFTEEVRFMQGEYVLVSSSVVKEYARKAAIMVEGGTLPHPPELTKDTTVAQLRNMAESKQEFEGFYLRRNGDDSRFATTAEIKPANEPEIWKDLPDADEKDGSFFVTDNLVIALLAMLPRKGFISPNPVTHLGQQTKEWDCQQENRLLLNLVRGVTSTGHVDSSPIGLQLEVRNPDAELRAVEEAEDEGLSEKDKKRKMKKQQKAEEEAEAKREQTQYPNKLDISVYLPSLLAVIAIVSQFHGEDGNEIASAFQLLLEADNAQFAAADAANRGEYQLKAEAEADSKQEPLKNLITRLLVAPDIKKCVTNVVAAFSDWAKQTKSPYFDYETMEGRAQSEVRSVQKKIREEGLHRSLGDWPGDLNLEKHFGITKKDLVALETIGQYLGVANAIVADRGHKFSTWMNTSIENIGFDNANAHTQVLQLCQPAMEQHAADQHEAWEAYHAGMDHPGADEQNTFTRIVCEMNAKQMLTLWLTANQTTPEDTKAAGEVLTRPAPPSLKWFEACITTVQFVLLQHQLQPAFMMSMFHMLIDAEKRVTEAAKEAAKEAAEEAAKDAGVTWDEKVFEENWTPPNKQMIGDFNKKLLRRYGTRQRMDELIEKIQELHRDVCSEKSPLHTLLETLDNLITDPSKWPNHVKACISFTDEETEMWNGLCTLFKKLDSVNADSTGLLKELLGDWESHRKTPANARLHILALVVLNEYSPVNLLVFNSPSECIAQFEGGSDENVKTAAEVARNAKIDEMMDMAKNADSVKSTLPLTDAVRNLIPSDEQAHETALALVSQQDRQNADSTQRIATTTTRNLIEVDGLGKDHERPCDIKDDPEDLDRNSSDDDFDDESGENSGSGDESDEYSDKEVKEWSELSPEQQEALDKLGYNSEMWNGGKHPDSSYKEFDTLEDDEVDLWKIMDRNEDNWLFWLDNESSSEYSFDEGSGSDASYYSSDDL